MSRLTKEVNTLCSSRPQAYPYSIGDDFRTALRNSRDCISALVALNSDSSDASNVDRQFIEVMTSLVGILQKNLRVRYEIKVPELVQPCVFLIPSVRLPF